MTGASAATENAKHRPRDSSQKRSPYHVKTGCISESNIHEETRQTTLLVSQFKQTAFLWFVDCEIIVAPEFLFCLCALHNEFTTCHVYKFCGLWDPQLTKTNRLRTIASSCPADGDIDLCADQLQFLLKFPLGLILVINCACAGLLICSS